VDEREDREGYLGRREFGERNGTGLPRRKRRGDKDNREEREGILGIENRNSRGEKREVGTEERVPVEREQERARERERERAGE